VPSGAPSIRSGDFHLPSQTPQWTTHRPVVDASIDGLTISIGCFM
jgi:hypothetical protein